MVQILRPENIAPLVKASGTQITMAATHNSETTRINLGSAQYKLSTALVLDTSVSGAGGIIGSYTASTIWNIFAVVSSGSVTLTATTATSPSGFTRYKFLGKFISTNSPATISHVMNKGEPFVEYVSNSSTTDADDGSSYVHDIQGSTGILGVTALSTRRTKQVNFLQTIRTTDFLDLEIDMANAGQWVPFIGCRTNPTHEEYSVLPLGYYGGAVSALTSSAGVGWTKDTGVNVNVLFGRYQILYNSYTSGWNSTAFSAAGARWRMKKVSDIITGP